MFVRAYLRASTEEQDAERARGALEDFATSQGVAVAAWHVEHASGATLDRPELRRLLDDATAGDVVLVESIDRLSRLPASLWRTLRHEIEARGVRVVALDLPTSHAMLGDGQRDDFTNRMLDALNAMLLDVLAAVAHKDYEDRRRRQAEGIAKAQSEGRYRGRPIDKEKHQRVVELLSAGLSIRKVARHARVSTTTVQKVKKATSQGDAHLAG